MEGVPLFNQPEKMKLSGHDQAVMATAQDALATKVYASGLNYFQDNYSKLFATNKRKMYPIINRGTWARVQAYRQYLLQFLNAFKNHEQPLTVLNLGAGYDTTFFWLHDNHPDLAQKVIWIEIDYDVVVKKKTEIIKKT